MKIGTVGWFYRIEIRHCALAAVGSLKYIPFQLPVAIKSFTFRASKWVNNSGNPPGTAVCVIPRCQTLNPEP